MMKRLLLLACAALLLLAGGLRAQTVTLDGITYTVNADGQTVSVTGADVSIAAAVVPATVNINGKDCPVTAIGSTVFSGCTSLASIALPEGLQSIGDYAFSNCWSLQSIALPEGLQTINGGTFDGCTALQSVDLPSTMLEIASGVFEDADLRDVYSRAVAPPSIYDDTFSQSTYLLATLHVPAEAVEDYRSATGWVLFDHIESELPPSGIGSVAADASLATYANGVLTTESPAGITVYAQSGAKVLHAEAATSLSLAGLPRGIYIINVEMDGQQQVMKVIH